MGNFEIYNDKYFIRSILINNMINGGIVAPKIRTYQNINNYAIYIYLASIDYSNYSVTLTGQYLDVEVKSGILNDDSKEYSLYSFVFHLPKEISEGEVCAKFKNKELIIEINKGSHSVKTYKQIPIIKES
ncbi:MAG: Hsp20/alpha crystallin family protein [Cyclobacteriaceae bacterium]|nr:Hsp20/alpha crystallin family protein [Cyclobacteriaceae bacterium]